MRTLNKWCAILGLGIALGLSLIGNAQLVQNESFKSLQHGPFAITKNPTQIPTFTPIFYLSRW